MSSPFTMIRVTFVEDKGTPNGVLEATLWFIGDVKQRTGALTGRLLLTEDNDMGKIDIIENDLGFDEQTCRHLITAACRSGWNAIMLDGANSVGGIWVSVRRWLDKHFYREQSARLAEAILCCLSPP